MEPTPAKKTYREYVNEAKEKIRELFQKETAMHVTEMRVRLDGSVDSKAHFFHWITYDALKELYNEGELRRRPRKGQIHVEGEEKPRSTEMTFYYPSKFSYAEVAPTIREKMELITWYSSIASEAGTYAQELIKRSMDKANFQVLDENTRKFKGKEWHGFTDLDLVVFGEMENRHYGVQVKNMLTYPDWDDVATLIDICDFLGLNPWFVARQLPGDYTYDLWMAGGFYTILEKWLLSPRHSGLASEISRVLKLPIICDEQNAITYITDKLKEVHSYRQYKGK